MEFLLFCNVKNFKTVMPLVNQHHSNHSVFGNVEQVAQFLSLT